MPNTEETLSTKCGFIAILGAPNVGKSTLLNQLVGSKVSIVTPKVQTTRTRVLGIAIHGTTQLVFVDTPGIFRPRRRLDRAMVAASWVGARNADHIIVMVDAERGVDSNTKSILKTLAEKSRRADLILNKVDLVKKYQLLATSAELNKCGLFNETFMISAKNGEGVADLIAYLTEGLPEGPWLFPEDQISDMPEHVLAAEVTREKIYFQLHKELPYATVVETVEWEALEDDSIRIRQIIYVQRDSQKAIVIGKTGSRIKAIGADARKELESLFGCPVHLFLFVKVHEKWEDDPKRYRDWGLDFNASDTIL